MRIKCVEISNFRKLKAVRIEFAEQTTVLVGANNSGKTSAMVALGHFLVDPQRFVANDITLANWKYLNPIGKRWEKLAKEGGDSPSSEELRPHLPALDLWLEVPDDQLHFVAKMVPTLDWGGGLLGVRLQLEPQSIEELAKKYLAAITAARETTEAAKAKAAEGAQQLSVELWPTSLRDFLERKLTDVMAVRSYSLDPAKLTDPQDGVAVIQALDTNTQPLDVASIRKLIRVDEVHAERNMGGGSPHRRIDAEAEGQSDSKRKLSEQLRTYYRRHLDPSDYPDADDVNALDAIDKAQKAFDEKLKEGFKSALLEMEDMGYPGVSDPKIKIATQIRPVDGMNHAAAVRYEVMSSIDAAISGYLHLPEDYNGLGYQNLIYIVFKLMSFRDHWMQVGKIARRAALEEKELAAPCPLHLVLIEEPEAHLHAQVQQVFVRKAYDVLRKHKDLGEGTKYRTQLVLSTHSSHVAHECRFSWLRYFRRLPASAATEIPTSVVVNLSHVFGPNDETNEFVTRYLRSTHCDLFFADAAILVEGPAERMLLPHFMRGHFDELRKRYITLLEIGGSHAHRMRPLIDALGLTTLVVTDLDSADADGTVAVAARNQGQITKNPTLKSWLPAKTSLDALLDAKDSDKQMDHPHGNAVMAVYQIGTEIDLAKGGGKKEYIPYTFEDALLAENPKLLNGQKMTGLAKKLQDAWAEPTDIAALGKTCKAALGSGGKAEFACDLLAISADPKTIIPPTYISHGLKWLSDQLKARDIELGLDKAPAKPGPNGVV